MRPKHFLVVTVAVGFIFLVGPLLFNLFTTERCPARGQVSSNLFPDRSSLQDLDKTYATAQWARKYETACTTCHTVFPRLNYYGEKFMQNGFQDPDNELNDGDTKGKKQYDNLFIGKVEDWFGARVSFEPIKVQTNGLTENGTTVPAIDIGKANWIQLFTAGSVAKNVSFFNELEIDSTGAVKHGWLVLGFHNVVAKRGLVNFQLGKISPVEWTSFSNRLRIFPEIQGFASKIKSSSGAAAGVAEDAVDISSAQWGTNYYGYAGPLVWTLGAGNGAKASDVNQQKNFWGSVRYDLTNGDSTLEGSSVSMFAYRGVDTAATATAQIENVFYRLEPSVNVRWNEKLDLVGSFHYGKDDNITLTAGGADDWYYGTTGIVSYMLTEKVMSGIQYDSIRQDSAATLEDDRLAYHVSFFPRENIRLIFTADTDLLKSSGTKNHQFFTTVRMMF